MTKSRSRAKELAVRPYSVIVVLDETTDGEPVYIAIHPELTGSMAQGDTIEEAQQALDAVRVDLIEHLLEHDLPVPEPMWFGMAPDTPDRIELDPDKSPQPIDAAVYPQGVEGEFQLSFA